MAFVDGDAFFEAAFVFVGALTFFTAAPDLPLEAPAFARFEAEAGREDALLALFATVFFFEFLDVAITDYLEKLRIRDSYLPSTFHNVHACILASQKIWPRLYHTQSF